MHTRERLVVAVAGVATTSAAVTVGASSAVVEQSPAAALVAVAAMATAATAVARTLPRAQAVEKLHETHSRRNRNPMRSTAQSRARRHHRSGRRLPKCKC